MKFENVYFLGIGGIGMSAIARYFLHQGKTVGGYDRTATPLTDRLQSLGAYVTFEDSEETIPEIFRDPAKTIVVYTPAIPADSVQKNWFIENGYLLEKRSEMLGHLTEGKYVMAVAGTHGKTTVSTMVAWLNHCAAKGGIGGDGTGSAFLGGISKNFDGNLVLGTGNRMTTEADEFDRSFLRLSPDAAVITSTDADHLDIYGTHENLKKAFVEFTGKIKPGGSLVLKLGTDLAIDRKDIRVYTYSLDGQTDFHARNIRPQADGCCRFDIVCPDMIIEDCKLGVPGIINVENAVAATALMWIASFDPAKLRTALPEFRGIKRRFEIYINTPELVYMDDYAHHPCELRAAIESLRAIFPGRKIKAIFQPHLYTRTRDFHVEFARALSLSDEVILLPIYPARELPIDGVESEIIARDITVPNRVLGKNELAPYLATSQNDIVVSFGAGDIDKLIDEIRDSLTR